MDDEIDKFTSILSTLFSTLAKNSLSPSESQKIYLNLEHLLSFRSLPKELNKDKCYLFLLYNDIITTIINVFDKETKSLTSKLKEFLSLIDDKEFKDEKEAIIERYRNYIGSFRNDNIINNTNPPLLKETKYVQLDTKENKNNKDNDTNNIKVINNNVAIQYQPNQKDFEKFKKFSKEITNIKTYNTNQNNNNFNKETNLNDFQNKQHIIKDNDNDNKNIFSDKINFNKDIANLFQSPKKREVSHEKNKTLSEKRFKELMSAIQTSNNIQSFIENSLLNDFDIYKYFHYYKELSHEIKYFYINLVSIFFPFLTKTQEKEILNVLDKYFSNEESSDDIKIVNYFKEIFLTVHKNDVLKDFIKKTVSKKKYEFKKETEHKYFFEMITTEDVIIKYQLYFFYSIFTQNNINYQFNEVELKMRQLKFLLMTLFSVPEHIPLIKNSNLIKNLSLYRKFFLTNLTINNTAHFSLLDANSFSQFELNNTYNVKELFSDQDFIFRENIMETISHFYQMKNSLNQVLLISNQSNINFVFKIIERNYRNELFNMNKSLQEIKTTKINILKTLEKEIKDLYNKKKPPLKYNQTTKCYDSFEIPIHIKNSFDYFYQQIKSAFPTYATKFSLYPFGSMTEFIGSNVSDLDLYLDITKIEFESKPKFLEQLQNYIIKTFDKKCKSIISSRICVIHFTLNDGLQIDISCLGYCPYMHSNLYRAYSLMDARYSILVICIKELISILKIKNSEEQKLFLNSFCWTMLITVFLQEIISPPILPKIMENSKLIQEKVMFAGVNKLFKGQKSFFNFFNNIREEAILVPSDKAFNNYKKIYQEQIYGKNTMSVGELLLRFLEFVVYFFKCDSLYISGSYPTEGIKHLSTIHLIKNEDFRFYTYYNKRYKKAKTFNSDITITDGIFLFREPFDGGYNPGQSLKEEAKNTDQTAKNIFYSKLMTAIQILNETGSFKQLKQAMK